MRKFLCIFIAILTLLAVPALAEENLLTNGDFSAGSGRFPDGWTTELWYTDEGVSVLDVEDGGYDGRCIRVSNLSDNDARFAQKVSVEPDTLYRISCMCRAEGISEDGIGATLSVKDTFSYSESLYDTDGQWQELTVYGRTGEEQTELTLYARVGGYGSLNTGTAWFDDISMEAVADAPAGAEVLSFDVVSKSSSNEEKTFGAAETDAEPKRNTEAFVLLTALYLLAVLAVVRKTRRSPERKDAFYGRCMAALLAVAFALRAVLAVCVRGYYTDVNCFTAWSEHIFSVGAAKFYNSGVWCDYPPGYMLMLWPVAALRSLFGLSTQSSAYLFLLKLWPIAFDLAGAWLLWRRGKERLGARAALMLAAFFALSPAAFTDSAAWGQIDSVFTLMIALCALEAADGRYVPSLTSFALAVLIKPQALLFAPLGLVAVVVFCIREKSARASMSMLKGMLAAVGLLYHRQRAEPVSAAGPELGGHRTASHGHDRRVDSVRAELCLLLRAVHSEQRSPPPSADRRASDSADLHLRADDPRALSVSRAAAASAGLYLRPRPPRADLHGAGIGHAVPERVPRAAGRHDRGELRPSAIVGSVDQRHRLGAERGERAAAELDGAGRMRAESCARAERMPRGGGVPRRAGSAQSAGSSAAPEAHRRAADGGGHADLCRGRVHQSRIHEGAPDHVGVSVGGRQRDLRSG